VLDREEEEEQTEHTWRPGDSCPGTEFTTPDRQLAQTNIASFECLAVAVVTNTVTCHVGPVLAIVISSLCNRCNA